MYGVIKTKNYKRSSNFLQYFKINSILANKGIEGDHTPCEMNLGSSCRVEWLSIQTIQEQGHNIFASAEGSPVKDFQVFLEIFSYNLYHALTKGENLP